MRAFILFCVLLPDLAFATSMRVRVVSMGDYTRLVIQTGVSRTVLVEHRGDRLLIRSEPPVSSVSSSGHDDLVQAAKLDSGAISFQLGHGAIIRRSGRADARLIDVFPSETVGSRSAAQLLSTAATLIEGLPPAFATSLEKREGSEPVVQKNSNNAPDTLRVRSGLRKSVVANEPEVTQEKLEVEPTKGDASSPSVMLPFSADVGVAGIRHSREMLLYFDEARPLDLTPLRGDPTLSHASLIIHPSFTELRLPIEPSDFLYLQRRSAGWQISVEKTPPRLADIAVVQDGSELHFGLATAGKVLQAVDAVTGAYLLIGTDRLGQDAVKLPRRSVIMSVDQSEFGVVVEAPSDRLMLRPVHDGFALSREDARSLHDDLQNIDPNRVAARADSGRSFTLATSTVRSLWRRLDQQLLAAAKAAPRSRQAPRLAAAQTMLALGLDRDARSLARVIMADAPGSADSSVRLLRAISEFLCDPTRADLLEDPALPESDETRLWRALASTRGSTATDSDAAMVRGSLPLLLSYPTPLRDIAAGLAAPILLSHGGAADLEALAHLPTTARTAVFHTLALERVGEKQAALTRLAELARDRDLKTSSDALMALLSLEVASKRLKPSEAAEILDHHRLDFRAVGDEPSALLQEARFSLQAGQFPSAFAVWRELADRYPDRAREAQAEMAAFMRRLVEPKSADALSPAEFVSLVMQCPPEVMSSDGPAAAIAPLLAQRLEDLDLPGRAIGVLRQLMNATPSGETRSELGDRLAELLLDQGRLADAEEALDQSAAKGLPERVIEKRELTLARIIDGSGDHAKALAILNGHEDGDAREVRATIEASLGRWHEAKLDLAIVASRLPQTGPLSRTDGDIVIRLATAASRDDDVPLVTSLAKQVAGRFPEPEQENTFNILLGTFAQNSPPPASRGG